MSPGAFQKEIYTYYRKHGRSHLPWRHIDRSLPTGRQAYKILVSEVMLQQTQVDRVIPKYKAFLKKFPTVKKLAQAKPRDVLEMWSGLGYNRRALYLKRAAETIVRDYKGIFPKTKEALVKLPGIGSYTAGAISAFAYNQPEVFIETNIRTVFIHFFFPHTKKVSDTEILRIVGKTLDIKNPREWYGALMDYGVMLKAKGKSGNKKSSNYSKQKPFQGSLRQIRGAIFKYGLERQLFTIPMLQKRFPLFLKEKLEQALAELFKDGLLQKKGKSYMLVSL